MCLILSTSDRSTSFNNINNIVLLWSNQNVSFIMNCLDIISYCNMKVDVFLDLVLDYLGPTLTHRTKL